MTKILGGARAPSYIYSIRFKNKGYKKVFKNVILKIWNPEIQFVYLQGKINN
jgi:hypothetical protein